MTPEYEKTLALEAELKTYAERLAEELVRIPSERNISAIVDIWTQMDRNRARLNSLFRSIRKIPSRPRGEHTAASYAAQRRREDITKRIKRCLMSWDSMKALVHRHIDPEPEPLELERPENASDPMLTKLHLALHQLANPNRQSDFAKDNNCFPDIPLSIQLFDALMLAAYRLLLVQRREDQARFIDVGCGGGVTTLAATRYFRYCDGLEYDPVYAAAGQNTFKLLNVPNAEIIEGNGVTFDRYGDYDVIYFYRPIKDNDILRQMELHIVNSARPGSIIIAPYDAYLKPRDDFPCARIVGPVFVAGLTQAEADRLRAEAERTSTDLIRRSRHHLFDTGFWTPVLDAASFNGS